MESYGTTGRRVSLVEGRDFLNVAAQLLHEGRVEKPDVTDAPSRPNPGTEERVSYPAQWRSQHFGNLICRHQFLRHEILLYYGDGPAPPSIKIIITRVT